MRRTSSVRRAGVMTGSLAALLVAVLVACTNDFDKFEGTPAPDPDASSPRADADVTDGSARGAAAPVHAGECRTTPETCVSARGTCRDACDRTRETCEDGCGNGGSGVQCRIQCRRTQEDCRDDCNDACRTCAGRCPTSSCR